VAADLTMIGSLRELMGESPSSSRRPGPFLETSKLPTSAGDRRFESISLQRRVRCEPRSGRSHLGQGQAVDLVDDHDVDRADLGQALLEAGCPTMQRSAVRRLELADGASTRSRHGNP
jgi:hypothetical protein